MLSVCRYVERNALTAGAVKNAQDWRWGSLWVRQHGSADGKAGELRQMLTPGAVKSWPRLDEWTQLVNTVQTKKELRLLDLSMERSRPFGGEPWVGQTVKRLGLEHTIRAEGRPPKDGKAGSK
jgi:putative transposase